MQFNRTLRNELDRFKKATTAKDNPCVPPPKPKERKEHKLSHRPEKVVGGVIKWQPIDRQAAMLLAKASWIHHPPQSTQCEVNKPIKNVKPMNSNEHVRVVQCESNSKVRSAIVNGETVFNLDDVRSIVAQEIAKLPAETRPMVKAAQDARQIIAELVDGLGGHMEKFRSDSKMYLEEIRQTRFAVVSEASQMTGPLREVRQFFLDRDYKEQIERLRDFVSLCERLQALKESGFLDRVADTMLTLSVK